jgi:hypothetical protein
MEERMTSGSVRLRRAIVVALHAIVGWAFCGAVVGVGRQFMTMGATLAVHALAAPLGFALISLFYFKKYGYTTPLQTAVLFVSIVLGLDLFVVAPFFEKSYAMFQSLLGTWIPFLLIFLSTYMTGKRLRM